MADSDRDFTLNTIEEPTTKSSSSLFKRRGKVAGNIRKKSTTTEDDENLEKDDGINRDVLLDFQAYQNSRTRTAGVTLDALYRGAPKEKVPEEKPTTVNTVLGSFSVHIDHGIQNITTPHAHIMEKYVNEKLNLSSEPNTSSEKSKKPKLDSELYQIPAQLEAEPLKLGNEKKGNSQVRTEEEGVISSWSTGIAEVELPIAYKLKNIEATEEATKNKLLFDEEIRLIRGTMPYSSSSTTNVSISHNHNHHQAPQTGFQRFQIVDRSVPKQLFDYSLSQFVNNDESLQQSLLSGNSLELPSTEELQRAQQHKKPQLSTDDIVMQNFRKRRLK